jgi:hypothetical protein
MPPRKTMLEAPIHSLHRAVESHARLVGENGTPAERAGADAVAETHAPVKHPARSQRRDERGRFT